MVNLIKKCLLFVLVLLEVGIFLAITPLIFLMFGKFYNPSAWLAKTDSSILVGLPITLGNFIFNLIRLTTAKLEKNILSFCSGSCLVETVN